MKGFLPVPKFLRPTSTYQLIELLPNSNNVDLGRVIDTVAEMTDAEVVERNQFLIAKGLRVRWVF